MLTGGDFLGRRISAYKMGNKLNKSKKLPIYKMITIVDEPISPSAYGETDLSV